MLCVILYIKTPRNGGIPGFIVFQSAVSLGGSVFSQMECLWQLCIKHEQQHHLSYSIYSLHICHILVIPAILPIFSLYLSWWPVFSVLEVTPTQRGAMWWLTFFRGTKIQRKKNNCMTWIIFWYSHYCGGLEWNPHVQNIHVHRTYIHIYIYIYIFSLGPA